METLKLYYVRINTTGNWAVWICVN